MEKMDPNIVDKITEKYIKKDNKRQVFLEHKNRKDEIQIPIEEYWFCTSRLKISGIILNTTDTKKYLKIFDFIMNYRKNPNVLDELRVNAHIHIYQPKLYTDDYITVLTFLLNNPKNWEVLETVVKKQKVNTYASFKSKYVIVERGFYTPRQLQLISAVLSNLDFITEDAHKQLNIELRNLDIELTKYFSLDFKISLKDFLNEMGK
jgi:hypothetical protein